MSIGWVIFWKAVVVAVWAAAFARYRAFKRKRKERGLPLRLDVRRGVYVVDDRLERFERNAKLAAYIFGGVFLGYTALMVYLFLAL